MVSFDFFPLKYSGLAIPLAIIEFSIDCVLCIHVSGNSGIAVFTGAVLETFYPKPPVLEWTRIEVKSEKWFTGDYYIYAKMSNAPGTETSSHNLPKSNFSAVVWYLCRFEQMPYLPN